MLEKQDQAGQPVASSPFTGFDNGELLQRLREKQEREKIAATAPEDIDISDLDPDEAADWDDLQWERALRSGISDDPDFWTRVRASEAAAGIVHEDDEMFDGFMPSEDMPASGAQALPLQGV